MSSILITMLFALLPACPTEDSTYCRWDAENQGNGTGTSFINIGTIQHGPQKGDPITILVYRNHDTYGYYAEVGA